MALPGSKRAMRPRHRAGPGHSCRRCGVTMRDRVQVARRALRPVPLVVDNPSPRRRLAPLACLAGGGERSGGSGAAGTAPPPRFLLAWRGHTLSRQLGRTAPLFVQCRRFFGGEGAGARHVGHKMC